MISEEVVTVGRLEEARRVLQDLGSVAKRRSDHWRRFCGLNDIHQSLSLVAEAPESQLARVPPVIFLFGVSCLLCGEAQVKALRLLALALGPANGKKPTPIIALGSDEDGEQEAQSGKDVVGLPFASESTPESVLNLSTDDMVAFISAFGLGGCTAEIRQLACSVVAKICCQAGAVVSGQVFGRLVETSLGHAGAMGKNHSEVFELLLSLLAAADAKAIAITSIAARVEVCWRQQMQAIRFDRSNQAYVYFETRSSASPGQKKRFELAPCVHCQQHGGRKEKAKSTAQTVDSLTATAEARVVGGKGWLNEQVTHYSRGRLEGWRDSSTSDEFNLYSSFKYRLVLSEVHLEINDPRVRFVKTISIYAAPRPTAEVGMLKEPIYESKWQRCGTISLSKGATRGNCKLDKPVVASNLRIEYTEFYERPGSSRSSDGSSFVVHCPRCKFYVNNFHSFCSI